MKNRILMTAMPLLLTALAAPPVLAAGEPDVGSNYDQREPVPAGDVDAHADVSDSVESRMEAQELVDDSAAVAQQMKQDEDIQGLLQKAKGVVIMPDFGKAALIVGGKGGEGLLVARDGMDWTNPVFYDFGGVSVGAQAGVEAGSVAMLLMSQKAVDEFKQDNNFALNADADLTIIDYSAKAEGNIADHDVVMWSDTEGLLAGVSVGGSDVNVDEEENRSYYGKSVSPTEILSGQVKNPDADSLLNSL